MANKRISINQQLCLSFRLYLLLSLLEKILVQVNIESGLDDMIRFLVGSRIFLLATASRLDLRLIQLCPMDTGNPCVEGKAAEVRNWLSYYL